MKAVKLSLTIPMKSVERFARLPTIFTNPWVIAAAAFAARAAFLHYETGRIPHEVLASLPFANEAGNIAYALSRGNGFSNVFRQATGATAWLAPVYPFLLSLIFRVSGAFTFASFLAAALGNCLFSAAATIPLRALGSKVFSERAGVWAGWMWAVWPAGVLMPTEWIWETSLSALLATTVAWLTVEAAETAKPGSWIGYGVVWAIALLTNPSLGIALPFLLLWAGWRARKNNASRWSRPALAAVTIAVCIMPWTVRDYLRFERVIPVRSNFAFELWIGNNDIFDEHAIGGRQRITRLEETRRYAELGETAYLGEKWSLARDFIRQKPALFLRLTERRVIATWTGSEHPLDDWRATDSNAARAVIVCNVLVICGMAAGAWFLARRRRELAFPILIFPALYPVVYYVTHTSLRYRHPIDPLLLLLTVIGAAGIPGRKKKSHEEGAGP
jgi:hypothetical protein